MLLDTQIALCRVWKATAGILNFFLANLNHVLNGLTKGWHRGDNELSLCFINYTSFVGTHCDQTVQHAISACPEFACHSQILKSKVQILPFADFHFACNASAWKRCLRVMNFHLSWEGLQFSVINFSVSVELWFSWTDLSDMTQCALECVECCLVPEKLQPAPKRLCPMCQGVVTMATRDKGTFESQSFLRSKKPVKGKTWILSKDQSEDIVFQN